MSRTLSDIHTYLKMMNLPKGKITTFLDRSDVVLYSTIRDLMTESELLELEIVIKDVFNNAENPLEIDFTKYISLDKKQRKIVSSMLDLKTTSALEIATIIQMSPKDLAFNIVNHSL
jgi:hypothetical protein